MTNEIRKISLENLTSRIMDGCGCFCYIFVTPAIKEVTSGEVSGIT